MSIKIEPEGFNTKSLDAWHRSSGKKLKGNLSRAIKKIAFSILKDAKRNAPVFTGALRASGRVIQINKFAQEIEFGGNGTGVNYAAAVEYGTGRKGPKPFLRPAVAKNQKEANRLIIKALKDANK